MKKVTKLTFTGIVCGITIGFSIALLFSAIFQSHTFMPSTPTFMSHFKSNMQATLTATFIWMLMGLIFALASLIFQKENWSITKQTVTHFIVTYLGYTPLAFLAGWYPVNINGLVSYTFIFISIYIAIWSSMMITAKKEVARLNQLLKKIKLWV